MCRRELTITINTFKMGKHVLVGAGNPLLDISSNVPAELLEK